MLEQISRSKLGLIVLSIPLLLSSCSNNDNSPLQSSKANLSNLIIATVSGKNSNILTLLKGNSLNKIGEYKGAEPIPFNGKPKFSPDSKWIFTKYPNKIVVINTKNGFIKYLDCTNNKCGIDFNNQELFPFDNNSIAWWDSNHFNIVNLTANTLKSIPSKIIHIPDNTAIDQIKNYAETKIYKNNIFMGFYGHKLVFRKKYYFNAGSFPLASNDILVIDQNTQKIVDLGKLNDDNYGGNDDIANILFSPKINSLFFSNRIRANGCSQVDKINQLDLSTNKLSYYPLFNTKSNTEVYSIFSKIVHAQYNDDGLLHIATSNFSCETKENDFADWTLSKGSFAKAALDKNFNIIPVMIGKKSYINIFLSHNPLNKSYIYNAGNKTYLPENTKDFTTNII